METTFLKQLMRLAAVVAVAAPSLVCAQQGGQAQGTQPRGVQAPNGNDEAARVGDRVITVREVDEAWRQASPAEHARATQMLYDGRRETLDRIVADLLIEQAAKARGVSPDRFAKDETAKRLTPVTDAEIASFYDQNKGRMQGKGLVEMSPLIRQFLEQQQQQAARQALVNDLRRSGPAVRVALDVPRSTVDVAATDPSRGAANAGVVLVEFSDYQ